MPISYSTAHGANQLKQKKKKTKKRERDRERKKDVFSLRLHCQDENFAINRQNMHLVFSTAGPSTA